MEIRLAKVKRDDKRDVKMLRHLQNIIQVRLDLIRMVLGKLLNFSWLQCPICPNVQNRNKYLL